MELACPQHTFNWRNPAVSEYFLNLRTVHSLLDDMHESHHCQFNVDFGNDDCLHPANTSKVCFPLNSCPLGRRVLRKLEDYIKRFDEKPVHEATEQITYVRGFDSIPIIRIEEK